MKKTLLIYSSLLGIVILNTGCLKRTVITETPRSYSYETQAPVEYRRDVPAQTQPQVIYSEPVEMQPQVIYNQPMERQQQVIYNQPVETQPQVTYNQPVEMQQQAIHTPPPSATPISVQTGEQHQLKTVQGPSLTVIERSNGFIFPQYRGKIILLEIFGKDCHFCFEEMPIIAHLNSKYRQNLQTVGIQAQEPMSRATATNLINRFRMNYPIVDKNNAMNLLLFIKKTYGWNGILPYMLVIKDGVTEYSFSGKVSQEELDEAIRSLI